MHSFTSLKPSPGESRTESRPASVCSIHLAQVTVGWTSAANKPANKGNGILLESQSDMDAKLPSPFETTARRLNADEREALCWRKPCATLPTSVQPKPAPFVLVANLSSSAAQ